MKCEYCDQHNPDNSLICERCGAPLPVEYTADMKIRYKYVAPYCTNCGRQLEETEAFCKECHTISPVVQKTFSATPKHNEQDYVRILKQYHGEYYTDCPHCKSTYVEKTAPFKPHIDSPIFICENCHFAYLRPNHYEWSVLSPKAKLEAISIGSNRWYVAFGLLALGIYTFFDYCLWSIPLSIPVLYVIHKLLDKKQVELSKMRLKQNPEYPQILAKMGYIHKMDQTHYHLVQYPPMTLKDIIKAAFTFD